MASNIDVAHSVALKLFAAEEAIDMALNKSAELAGFMPLARQTVGVSADIGQDAIEHLLDSMTKLSEARKQMINTHEALARTQTSARLAPRNFGGFINKPRYTASAASLEVVSRECKAA